MRMTNLAHDGPASPTGHLALPALGSQFASLGAGGIKPSDTANLPQHVRTTRCPREALLRLHTTLIRLGDFVWEVADFNESVPNLDSRVGAGVLTNDNVAVKQINFSHTELVLPKAFGLSMRAIMPGSSNSLRVSAR